MPSITDSGLRTNYAQIKFEEYERERLDEIYETISPYSEMEKNERYFLNGIIRYFRPKKILEVGVARGGGTAIILNAIRDLPDSQLISADYCEKFYSGNSYRTGKHGGNTEKLSGYIIDEKFSHLKDKWTIYRGGDISRFVEKTGGDIDLLVLDTAHVHPWETLNFLCVLPFMKMNHSWVVLHDINMHFVTGFMQYQACRYLFSSVVSDYKLMPVSDYDFHFANIGAFHIIDDTRKYARNLFESLLINWNCHILPEDIADIKIIINKYYPDYSEFFEHVIDAQEIISKRAKEQNSFMNRAKRKFPRLFRIAAKMERLIMNGKK